MRMVKSVRALWTLGIATMALLPLAGAASAEYATDISTERSGSIVIYPKVIWDGNRDTVIRIANTSNSMVGVHCFYVNGAQSCAETDFSFYLTKQHPIHWTASGGRSPREVGMVLGAIPPAPLGFIGELKCVQTDLAGAPVRGNALKGDAVLRTTNGDVSEYNAISFQGNSVMSGQDPNQTAGPGDLVYDLTPTNRNGMYSACPDTLLFNHMAESSTAASNSDPVSGRPITTELTLVPCNEDLENQLSSRVIVQFKIYNEFEQPLSTSTTVSCFMNSTLVKVGVLGDKQPFTISALGTPSAYTRITPADGNGGVLGLGEEFRAAAGAAAFNLQMEGNRYDAATNGDGDQRTGKTDHLIVPMPF